MRFTIIAVGELKAATTEALLVRKYAIRLSNVLKIIEVRPADNGSKERDTLSLLKAVPEGARVVVMDERGRDFTSRQFTDFLSAQATAFGPHLAFIIGGADGLDLELLPPDWPRICLGRLTWPHALARIMLVEQLYRAVQLRSNHPYHRD